MSKKVCPFAGKRDNCLSHKEIEESVSTVPWCALLWVNRIIPFTGISYRKVCPCAPHFGGRKGGKW